MAASKQWKVDERKVARALGGVRIALSGGRGASAKCDVVAGRYAVEVKRRKRCVISGWWAQACLAARRDGRTPALAVHVAGTQTWLVVLELREFGRLIGLEDSEMEGLKGPAA